MGSFEDSEHSPSEKELPTGIALKKSADSDDDSARSDASSGQTGRDPGADDGSPIVHQANHELALAEEEERKRKRQAFRKRRNQEARRLVADSVHRGVNAIVHLPEPTDEDRASYARLAPELLPIVRETARKAMPLLEHDESAEFARRRAYGSRFQADSAVYRDFKPFAKRRPPTESPSLAVALRIDESASMAAFGRLDAAKRAAVAVYELCRACGVPAFVYGDTADVSKLERMSVYAYADAESPDEADRYRLMGIRARSNNRDGLALRIVADRLAARLERTKLLISVSDGQPKAMDDYTGASAVSDMQRTIAEYERKGVTFLAAAIGQDKDVIGGIYGAERFLDITDLRELPGTLVRLIARYIARDT